jgi:hypothetical protein
MSKAAMNRSMRKTAESETANESHLSLEPGRPRLCLTILSTIVDPGLACLLDNSEEQGNRK